MGLKKQNQTNIRGKFCLRGLTCAALLLFAGISSAQSQTASDRKLLLRVPPKYPEYLEVHKIGGVVRVLVEITPRGNVRSVSPIGGNPILMDAAVDAVKQWKYVQADKADTVEVKIEFVPR